MIRNERMNKISGGNEMNASKLFRKTTALMLCLFVLFAATACTSGTSGSTNSTGGNGGESAVGQSKSSQQENEKPSEPVTLKVMSCSTNPNGTGPMDNEIARIIEEEVGVIMDLIPTSEQDAQQQLPAMIASNDLPDIFFLPETDTSRYINQMVQGGQILALDDYLADHAPNMAADSLAQVSLELKRQTLSPDGKVYAIGMQRGTYDAGLQPIAGQFIRWDLYAQLGYPEINDYDTDLLEVLKQMQELESTNASGEKVYAVGGWFGDSQGWGDWHITYNLPYAEGYTCLTPGDRIIYSDITTGKIVESNAQTDKESLFWRTVKWFNKANQMGILDPDSFTQKQDQYVSKLSTGRYLYINTGWDIQSAHDYFDSVNETEKGFTCLPPMRDDTDKFTLYRYYIAGQFNYGVSTGCKYPEKAVELLDWVSSYENARVIYDGEEGKHWNILDGVPTPTEEYLALDRSSPELQKTEGLNILDKFVGYGYATIEPSTGVAIDLWSSSPQALEKKMRKVHKDMLSHYGYKTMPEMYDALSPGGNIDMTVYNLGSLPAELQTYDANLQSYEFKNLFRCILAENDEEFDKLQNEYIEGLEAFHIDEIYEYWLSVGKEQERELADVIANTKKALGIK